MKRKILVTGHRGYIGSVLTPLLVSSGYEVVGLDTEFFADCTFGALPPEDAAVTSLRRDVRSVEVDDLQGVYAVMHLAALSNDPMGELDPDLTEEINTLGTIRLAQVAKMAGARRFIFSSSCSLYGAADTTRAISEDAPFNPVTAYARSKVAAESLLSELADGDFSPTFLRNATAYGFSPRLRGDLVLNDLVARSLLTGEITLLSDGTPWRPLVHVEDICRAFIACVEAPRHWVHDRAFNVGRNEDNFTIRELAEMVREAVPGTRVRVAENASPDARSYQVDFTRIRHELREFHPRWNIKTGIEELLEAYRTHGVDLHAMLDGRYARLGRLMAHIEAGHLDARLRWMNGLEGSSAAP